MGCLKLLIAEIAAYYSHSVARMFSRNHLLITYKYHQAHWQGEGIQVIITQILSVTLTFYRQ